MASNKGTDTVLLRELCKYFGVNYTQFGNVWTEKQIWQRRLWNQTDKLGFNQRVCRDVTNMILSEPVRIWTENDNINALIKSEIKGRLQLDSILSKNLSHCMGIGDMVMSVYIDPFDNLPAINYVPGYNVIPISFNNHSINELVWFQTTKVAEKTYVIATLEKLTSREIMLFEYSSMSLMMINYGTPLWTRVLGNLKPVYNYDEAIPSKKFAWISTGLNNARWIDTPFHNSFIWPVKYIDTLLNDWELLEQEYANSRKKIFVAPELIKRTYDVTDSNGMPIPMKKVDPKDTLFECVDLTDDKIKEWNPQVRFQEYVQKIKFDLQCWGMAVGLGAEMYNFDYPKVEMTATQVVLSHRDAFNTINNIKYNLESALQTIVFAMVQYWAQMGMISEEDLASVADLRMIHIKFDDGVFVNRSAKVAEGLQLYMSTGGDGTRAIDKFTLLTEYCGYPDETAMKIMQLSQEEFVSQIMMQMQMAALAGGGGEEQPQEEKK